MKLGQVLKTREVTIPFGEDALRVRYRSEALTPRLFIMLDVADEENVGEQTRLAVEVLTRVIAEWDLTYDDGKPYPVTTEALMELPLDFLTTVLQAITEDAAPKKANSVTSDGHSEQKDS